MIQPETGHPVPIKTRQGSPPTYPWYVMGVNQSFAYRGTLVSAKTRARAMSKEGRIFVAGLTDAGEVRIWRIA